MSRGIRRLVLAALVLAGSISVGIVMPQPSSALSQPPLTLAIDQPITGVDYAPVPGSWPGGQDDLIVVEPQDCTTPGSDDAPDHGLFAASCDNIPINIVVPPVKDEDDWVVELEVSFPDPSGEGLADFDIYLYDNKQVAPDEGNGWTRVAQGPGTTNPETIKIFEPDLGQYNLVVVNFAGVNGGYTLKGRIINAEFTAPFELLAPTFQVSGDDEEAVEDFSAASEETVTPFDFSAAPDDVVPPRAPVFGEVAAIPLADFEQFPSTDFEEELAAPTLARVTRSLPPVAPVSAPVVVFWLLLVPLVLLGAVIVVFWRRGRGVMAFG